MTRRAGTPRKFQGNAKEPKTDGGATQARMPGSTLPNSKGLANDSKLIPLLGIHLRAAVNNRDDLMGQPEEIRGHIRKKERREKDTKKSHEKRGMQT